MTNIRDQNTWVHRHDPEKATQKGKELVRMAVANAVYMKPLHQISLSVTKCAFILGGGVTVMEVALSIVEQECDDVLLEKTNKLGGNAKHLNHIWQYESVTTYMVETIKRVETHPYIKIYTEMEVTKTKGVIGNFKTTLESKTSKSTNKIIHHGVTRI